VSKALFPFCTIAGYSGKFYVNQTDLFKIDFKTKQAEVLKSPPRLEMSKALFPFCTIAGNSGNFTKNTLFILNSKVYTAILSCKRI